MEPGQRHQVDTDYMVLYLVVGTLVWHYLSVVFETVSAMISWERWEGTIEYTFMAPIRRLTQMPGTCVFSIVYGMLHTAIILAVIAVFFQSTWPNANLLGSIADPAGRQPQLHRHRHHGLGAADALHRARLADDLRHPVDPAAGLRRLLSRRRAAGLDAAAVAVSHRRPMCWKACA